MGEWGGAAPAAQGHRQDEINGCEQRRRAEGRCINHFPGYFRSSQLHKGDLRRRSPACRCPCLYRKNVVFFISKKHFHHWPRHMMGRVPGWLHSNRILYLPASDSAADQRSAMTSVTAHPGEVVINHPDSVGPIQTRIAPPTWFREGKRLPRGFYLFIQKYQTCSCIQTQKWC